MSFLKIQRKGDRKKNHAPDELEKSGLPLDKKTLGISEIAETRIKKLIEQKGAQASYLRVAIKGGGCSGLSIHYEFCDSPRDNDYTFEKAGAKVLIDKKSLSILGGATLHFKDYLGSGEFILLNNPAAKQCSCGQSLSFWEVTFLENLSKIISSFFISLLGFKTWNREGLANEHSG